jgi:hypothetical protein
MWSKLASIPQSLVRLCHTQIDLSVLAIPNLSLGRVLAQYGETVQKARRFIQPIV